MSAAGRSALILSNVRRTAPGSAEALAILREHGVLVDDPGEPLEEAEARRRAATVDAIVVGGTHPLGRAVLEAAPRLRVVSRQGVGMDNIDVAAATRLGVVVCNTAGCNADAVADHAFALLLHLCRDVSTLDRRTRAGRGWEDGWPPTLLQLAGRTLAILGTGNIGRAVAARAAAFGMRLLAHDLAPDAELERRLGVRYLPLAEMLPHADVLTVHVPLTDLTRGLIGAEALARLPSHALLINTARGGVVDEDALAEAIREGRLRGAGVDVFAPEPRGDSPLFALDRVVVTPHVGGSSVESWTAARTRASENLVGFFEGALKDVVNPEVLPTRRT